MDGTVTASIRNLLPVRRVVLYDGTNGEEALALLDPAVWDRWTFVSDSGGVLTVHDTLGIEDNRTFTAGQYLDVDADPVMANPLTDETIAGRYADLDDLQNEPEA